ncbi:YxiG family protein [Paenilisteria rocourtiae]|uniref:Immunity protein 50 of polymorphic toxin system n=2 Tax=Listeria rocourtiae TaxID=647910 RepID=A0A4R6ZDK0_9LIST|nr:hypothetical protein [Listeria rocourtiae]MBC1435327.1 hypothetical protein [Listeria rocourtiae]TDR50163.1 hypothetical protein DFP96_1362 [Listeria rocourtiae]
MELFKVLSDIEEALIESHSIDIQLNTIQLKLVYPDNSEKVDVIFRKVSTFYFVNGYEDSRYATSDYEYGEKRELLSISYSNLEKQSLLIKSRDSFYIGFDSKFNFTLEFMEGLLLIEADEIEINSCKFESLI